MAKLINIGKILVGFNQKPMLDTSGGYITIKDILLQYAGNHTSQDGRKRIATRLFGEKLFKADRNNELELSDAEFKLLELMLQKPAHPDIILTQIDEMMDEVKDVKKDK